MRLELVSNSLVFIVLGYFSLKWLIGYFMMVYLGWVLIALHNYGQHLPIIYGTQKANSYLSGFYNWLFVNNGLHEEHHEEPSKSYWELQPNPKTPHSIIPKPHIMEAISPAKNKDRMFNSNHISSVLFKHRAKAAAFALVLLLLGSLGLNKIHVTGNLGGFNAPGVTVFEDAKAFDSLFGGVRSNVVVSVTPKKNAQYSMWKECAEIENGIRKLSPSIEIISPRRFIRGYYGVVDPSHSISTDSLLSALSTHPQLGRLISKDQTSFLFAAEISKR